MRILYVATREVGYVRNDVLIRALRKLSEVDVVGSNHRGNLAYRSFIYSIEAARRLSHQSYDLVVCGFFGQITATMLAKSSPSPLLLDGFVSAYDTLCYDRKAFSPNSPAGKLAFWLDKTSCRQTGQVLTDTPENADYFRDTFNLPQVNFYPIPVSCNEEIFKPISPTTNHFPAILAHFYSTYQSLHGVEQLLHVAKLLEEEPFRFSIIGNGPQHKNIIKLSSQLRLRNVVFLPMMPLRNLVLEMGNTDIFIGGPFGSTSKAGRVIPGKIYQAMAMGLPIIAADTPANRRLLVDRENAILVDPKDPNSIADGMKQLAGDNSLRKKIARNARSTFMLKASEEVICEILSTIISKIIQI